MMKGKARNIKMRRAECKTLQNSRDGIHDERIEKILAFFRMLYVGAEMMGHGMGMDHPGINYVRILW
jgi:hypothetical protein